MHVFTLTESRKKNRLLLFYLKGFEDVSREFCSIQNMAGTGQLVVSCFHACAHKHANRMITLSKVDRTGAELVPLKTNKIETIL